jgi:hypothetical protein
MVYQSCADGMCAASTVRIANVRGNQEPTPVANSYITDEDHPIDFNPLLDDTDPDGDPLHLNSPCYEGWNWPFFRGTLDCHQDGSCNFSPFPQETGVGEILCEVCDELYCVTETVELTVLRVPNPPECFPDTAATSEDTPVEIRVLADDAFNGGRPVFDSMYFDPAPAHGSAVVDVETGFVTYTPATDYAGPTDAFRYNVCDVYGLCCSAPVSLAIEGIEDPPAFTSAPTNTNQTIARTGVPTRLYAVDPEGGALTYARIAGSLPDHVTLEANGTFTSTGGHHKGTYTSTIQVTDAASLSATTTLRIVVQ